MTEMKPQNTVKNMQEPEKVQKNELFFKDYTINRKNFSLMCNDAPHQKNKSKPIQNLKGTNL